MRLLLIAVIASLLATWGAKAVTLPYSPPPGSVIHTTFGWLGGESEVHGISAFDFRNLIPYQLYTEGDMEWVVDVPAPGGKFLILDLYTDIDGATFELRLNGTPLVWDYQIQNWSHMYNLILPAGQNIFTMEILTDGTFGPYGEPLSPNDLRYASFIFNNDPGVGSRVPIPPPIALLAGALVALPLMRKCRAIQY